MAIVAGAGLLRARIPSRTGNVSLKRRGSRHASTSQTALNALKLYTNVRSRGKIVEWYLNELGTDYEAVEMNMAEKEHKSDWFLQINPLGKVPALQDGDLTMFESGAMLQYIAEKYGPADTPEKRAQLAKWVVFANATLSNAIFLDKFRDSQMPLCMEVLQEELKDKEYLLGSFGAADVAVGSLLLYTPIFFPDLDLSKWPGVVSYMTRLQSRPACTIKPVVPVAA